jgi:ABC-type antimicrobial peptide transport system permease subunit
VLIIRTTFAPDTAIPLVRTTIHELDPSQPIYHVRTLFNVLSDSMALQRLTSILLAAFAMVALLLAMIGIYGVLSYSVVQRTREIGLRIAVGAQTADILRLVLGRAFRLAAAGIAAGLILAFLCARVANGLLFETSAFDPLTIVLTIIGLVAMTAAAAGIPARRAAKLNPTEALRAE